MDKGRVSNTAFWLLLAEVAGKVLPLLTLRFAQDALGMEAFGQAQMAVYLTEIVIPVAVFGYATLAGIELGRLSGGNVAPMRRFIGIVTGLRIVHALAAFAALAALVTLVPNYTEYRTAALVYGMTIFIGIFDFSYLNLATQRMRWVAWATMVGKAFSLLIVWRLVHSPDDLLLFLVAYACSNVFLVATTVVTNRRYLSWSILRWPDVGSWSTFRRALPFAASILLLIVLERFDVFLVEHFWGSVAAGTYSGPLRLVGTLVPLALAITTPVYSEMVSLKDSIQWQLHARFAFWLILAGTVPIALGGWFVAEPVLAFVLGDAFRPGAHAFAILLLAAVPQGLIMLLGWQLLPLKGRAAHANVVMAGGIVLGIGLAGVFVQAIESFDAIAWAVCITKYAMALTFLILARGMFGGFPWNEAARVLGPGLGMAAALFGLRSFGIVERTSAPWAIMIAVGAVTYSLFLAALNQKKVAWVWGKLVKPKPA